MGFLVPEFSETKVEMVDGDAVTIECITAVEVDAMTERIRKNSHFRSVKMCRRMKTELRLLSSLVSQSTCLSGALLFL